MSIFSLFKKLKPTKPYIGVEFGITEEAIYKRLKMFPYLPDELLRRKGIKIYEEMMRDEEISSAIEGLKILRLSSGWDIIPASNEPKDKEIADFVKWNLENVEGSFEDDLKDIMGALEFGISICEIVWDVCDRGKYKDKIVLRSIKSKNPRYFNILTDDFDNILENGIVNLSSIDYGRQYPTEKFIIYSFNKRYENVFGRSRLRELYDIWYFKQMWLRAWSIYLEKFGHPIPIAKYPVNIEKEVRDKIWEVIKNIKYETAIMIPQEFDIELKEASARGGDMFLTAINFCNNQIRKVIMGQTLTSEQGKVGSYALGRVHFDILLFYLEQLGKDVASKAINQQLIRRLVDYNFSNIDDYPKFEFKPLLRDDIEMIIDKYYAGVDKGIIRPIPEDEDKIREWLRLPKRKEEDKPAPIIEEQKKEEEFVEFEDDINKIFTGTARKRFTKYEQIVDFAEIKQTIEEKTEKTTKEISKIIQESVQDMINQTQKLNILETKNIEDIEKIKFPATGEIKNLFSQLLKSLFDEGIKSARKEISLSKTIKKNKKYSEIVKFQWEVDIRKIKPQEILDWLDKHAYDLAGDIKDYIMSEYRDILKNAILRGDDIKSVINALDKVIKEYVAEGILYEALPGYRLEAIVRTHITQTYNLGRKSFFEDPQLKGYVVGYQYSAILDARTSTICEWLDNKTYSVYFRDLEIITPPNHWNCRSLLIPITLDDEIEEFDNKLPPKNILEMIKKFKKI
ncbi:MAG: DUF935 family protein [Elusimicrobiota bacterium]|nr:DUF935 family protein [Elusimicrobiota bacterium]